jgi:hypothetical protein
MNLTYQRYTFTIKVQDTINLPYYKGSTFRGGFGNAFRSVVCTLRKKECKDCMLCESCIYAYIFETSPVKNTEIMGMDKYKKILHPFIIEPPDETRHTYNQGERISFGLVLIGKAIDYLPYFIFTFDELGKRGLGRGRGKYQLIDVGSEGKNIYSIEDKTIKANEPKTLDIPETYVFGDTPVISITLRLITPVRISYQRNLVTDLQFHVLIRSLLRRINLLHYFHCEKSVLQWDHKKMIHEAEKVGIQGNALRWWDWERYSSRQDIKMKMGGVVGEISYSGHIEPFLPILKAGEVLHIGKGTSFGLGKYRIVHGS